MAKKLLGERHPDSELITSRQEALGQAWSDLRTVAKYRDERLRGAHEIQKFNRSDDQWKVEYGNMRNLFLNLTQRRGRDQELDEREGHCSSL